MAACSGEDDNGVRAILPDAVERIDKVGMVSRREGQRSTFGVKLYDQHGARVTSHLQTAVRREVIWLNRGHSALLHEKSCCPMVQPATTTPPAARIVSPVIQADSSDARNTASGAMSVTRPSRPSGVFAASVAPAAPSTIPAVAVPSVSVWPGEIALTRIFRGANSSANPLVNVSIAPFVDA